MTVRPLTTVLDVLRARIDHTAFDAVAFSLDSVVADLGYGDVRPLPGSIAWIDALRAEGKAIGLVFAGDNPRAAVELAGVGDRFDAVAGGPDALARVLEALDVPAQRAIAVDTAGEGIQTALRSGLRLTIALARGPESPEALRRAGAAAIVADLHELLRAT